MTERILTTHTGSLPRPGYLLEMLAAHEEGEEVDKDGLGNSVHRAVAEAVGAQMESGIDIINDGEVGKPGYTVYIKDRLTGFEGDDIPPFDAPWAKEFPEFYRSWRERGIAVRCPPCTGPIAWKDREGVQRDIANLKAALQGREPAEVFMTAPSPGVAAAYHKNRYYDNQEAYLHALADVLKYEYDSIHRAGFLLQVDCPDLTSPTTDRQLHIQVLNFAVRDIPPERMRVHACWGNYEGPHHQDLPLEAIISDLLTARPAGLSIEGANPRHEHEWKVFETVKLPDGKVLIPGVIDSTTNYIEHPELVAQRIVRYAQVVGRANVIAGTDCGMATNISLAPTVDPRIAWAKLQAMVEGARYASRILW